MDVAAERARRKNRSSTNINHLTLGPLTSKLPLRDDEFISHEDTLRSAVHVHKSYIEGRSAPTTPRLFSHSPAGPRSHSRSRSNHRRNKSGPDGAGTLPKSKSSSHIAGRQSVHGGAARRRKDEASLGPNDRNDSDWIMRAGAVMTSEAREYKGQAWLVSRQSSTSLSGMRDPEAEAFERELVREREIASRQASRRGSSAEDTEESPHVSRLASRSNSRSHSLARGVLTPLEKFDSSNDSYFDGTVAETPEQMAGPDFVNLDEKLEELERDTSQDDEATVRKLVRRGKSDKGTWISSVVGWSLFAVDETDEETDENEEDGVEDAPTPTGTGRSSWPSRHFEGVSNGPEEKMPPPSADEGAWRDAAWLLSVASKVMF